jgi:hypothetical protein
MMKMQQQELLLIQCMVHAAQEPKRIWNLEKHEKDAQIWSLPQQSQTASSTPSPSLYLHLKLH